MIKKYIFGNPYNTESTIKNMEASSSFPYKKERRRNTLFFTIPLTPTEQIFGLGENMHGINKRGFIYTSFNMDNPFHKENMTSLYGSHNFFLLEESLVGFFFDDPGKVVFHMDPNKKNKIIVTTSRNVCVYVINASSMKDIVHEFLGLIGRSYIPPLWAFGFGQSRWGYKNKDDIDEVINGYLMNHLPLDYVCLDIDYMDRYIDFTINKDRFPHFLEYVKEKKEQGIHLVPIIDAGVKIEPGNDTYDTGIKHDYFTKDTNGGYFCASVWPGLTHYPDFYRQDARDWFGKEFLKLTKMGIEGFWLDMNEPAFTYSNFTKNLDKKIATSYKILDNPFLEQKLHMRPLPTLEYKYIIHNFENRKVSHDKVHNLFGGFMTRAAGEVLTNTYDKRMLLFSRSSYIGSHRFGGIWFGDNHSSWDMLKRNITMMPSVSCTGFLFSGADMGGFLGDVTEELLLRWTEFAMFSPLARNHSEISTKRQECYRFERIRDFQNLLSFRYKILPYLYSEFVKAALYEMPLFTPLSFEYPNDLNCKNVDDEILFGEGILLCPLTEEGKNSRTVYLPDTMMKVSYIDKKFSYELYNKGYHDISMPLGTITFFIRNNKSIILSNQEVLNTASINLKEVSVVGFKDKYLQYIDDGNTLEITLSNIRTVNKQ